MSKIKLILEELAEIQLKRVKTISTKIPTDPKLNETDRKELEGSAKVLGIITSALVELGESTSIESKVKRSFIEIPQCDWEGRPIPNPFKVKLDGILGYEERTNIDNNQEEVKLLEIQVYGRSVSTKMTLKEFEELLFGDHE